MIIKVNAHLRHLVEFARSGYANEVGVPAPGPPTLCQ